MHACKPPHRPIRQHPLSRVRLCAHAYQCNACVCNACVARLDLYRKFVVCIYAAASTPPMASLVSVAQWRYCQPFAERHSQIEDSAGTGHGRPGLNAETLKKSAKAMQKTMCDTAPSTQECATVISGCHVKWATTTVLNKGYIMEVVYLFKHESLSSQLISAFSTIDGDEIRLERSRECIA